MSEKTKPTKPRGGYRWTPTRRILRGREQRAAKLTDRMAMEIITLYIPGDRDVGATALARRFGVSRTLVQGVADRTRWKHLSAPPPRPWQ